MVCVLACWISLILYFDPRLLAFLDVAPNLVTKIAVVLFVLCLNSFWLYAIYHAVMITLSWWARHRGKKPVIPPLTEFPAVAVLYATRNDFREPSVATCLRLDYPNYRVFVLDDSTLPEYREKVDRWVAAHADRATLIRRPSHEGFKAGNLNGAMHRLKNDYPFFIICDADDFMQSHFIRALLPYFVADPAVGFVQAKQEVNPAQQDLFAQAIGYRTNVHYRHFVRARNDYGFVMFYGHGALIRTAAWEAVGGFPEIVTEDLAFSAKIREHGYRGRYEEDVVGYEDFPPTQGQLRTRAEKWIRGTTEYLRVGFPSLWRSRKVPWYEKVDVLINALAHHQVAVMFLFLLILGIVLPVSIGHFRFPGSFLLWPVPAGKTVFEYLIHIRHHVLWSSDFYLVMMGTMLIPLIPVIIDWRRSPLRVFRFLAVSTYVYLSSLVVETVAIGAYLATGTAVFWNTYDAAHLRPQKATAYHPNHPAVFGAEVGVGLLLAAVGCVTKNLWFIAPALALLLSPLLQRVGWKPRWMRMLTYAPCLIALFIIGIVTLDLAVNWVTNIGILR